MKHEFQGLLDNFKSYDTELRRPQANVEVKSTTARVDDARQRIRTMYAKNRSAVRNEGCRMKSLKEHYPSRKLYNDNTKESPIDKDVDTSAWTDNENDVNDRVDNLSARKIDINNISGISGNLYTNEFSSNSATASSFSNTFCNQHLHSTLNYPLHSTILEEHEPQDNTPTPATTKERVKQPRSMAIDNKPRDMNHARYPVNDCKYPIRSRSLKRQLGQVPLKKTSGSFSGTRGAIISEHLKYNIDRATCSVTCQSTNCFCHNHSDYYANSRVSSKRTREVYFVDDFRQSRKSKIAKSEPFVVNHLENDMSRDKEHKQLKASVRRKFKYFKRCSSQDTIHTLAHF